MKARDKAWHIRRCRKTLVTALFLLEEGPPTHAMVYAMLAVHRFSEWIEIDAVQTAIHDLTDSS